MAKEKLDINIKEANQGKFTAWAKKNGFKDTCSAAASVMKNKKKIASLWIKALKLWNKGVSSLIICSVCDGTCCKKCNK